MDDIGFELVDVDRPVESHRRDHAGHAQACDKRGPLAMVEQVAQSHSLDPATATVDAVHVGGRPSFVDEDQPRRIEVEQATEPSLAMA